MNALHFDEATHTYTLDGKRLPSVTEVIREVLAPTEYAGIPAHVLAHAADRGKAVEAMIGLDLADELDESSLAPELIPYWQAWQAFPDRMAWRSGTVIMQEMVSDSERGYAGTYDLRVDDLLIDIKATAQVPKTVGIQTAAYAAALACLRPVSRACLHVTPTGCQLIQLKRKADLADFYAALRVYQWRLQND